MGATRSTFALSTLLMELFSRDEFQRFLHEHYPEIRTEVSKEASIESYFDEVALALFRRNLVDEVFLNHLYESRPRQGRIISRFQSELGRSDHPSQALIEITLAGTDNALGAERFRRLVELLREMTGTDEVVVVKMYPDFARAILLVDANACSELVKAANSPRLRSELAIASPEDIAIRRLDRSRTDEEFTLSVKRFQIDWLQVQTTLLAYLILALIAIAFSQDKTEWWFVFPFVVLLSAQLLIAWRRIRKKL